jgi:xylose isomerase
MIQERKLSMPFWCVGNPVGDPFGSGILSRVNSLEIADILADAGKDGLIHYTAAHDDDLVPWDPNNPEDDLDKDGETYATLTKIKEKLESGNVRYNMIGCALHPDPVFRNGGVANPDPRVRLLASQKVMRALRIGNFLGAQYFTYWVARDGFETQFAVPWEKTYRYIQEALNLVSRYCKENHLSIRNATIEHKPNEPRGEMYLPTIGHSVVKKLFFIHVGAQKPGQFDNDNPPTIGMDGLKEMISIIYIINKYGWEGYIEFDNHMLRTDTLPGDGDKIETRKKYIALAVEAYRMVETKAIQLVKDEEIAAKQVSVWKDDTGLEALLSSGDTGKIAAAKIDYTSVVSDPIEIGELDLTVNKKLLGL